MYIKIYIFQFPPSNYMVDKNRVIYMDNTKPIIYSQRMNKIQ